MTVTVSSIRTRPWSGPPATPSGAAIVPSSATMGGLRGWVDQLGVDLRMLADGLRGRVPAPFHPRKGSRFDAWPVHRPVAGLAPRKVRVEGIVRETPDALTLRLQDLRRTPIEVQPGQFFTFLISVDGVELRRAYSASHDCRETDFFTVTIKRIPGGRVSNHLHETLREGDLLEVFGPSGEFLLPANTAAAGGAGRRLVFVAGGSGITPIMAMLRTGLATDPAMQAALIFGNRAAEDVIFADALAELASLHPGRLRVHHVLERVPDSSTGEAFEGPGIELRGGRLDSATLGRVLDDLGGDAPELVSEATHYFLCGPTGMMDGARSLLETRGVPAQRLHEERFASPATAPRKGDSDLAPLGPCEVEASVAGERLSYETEAGETLLEAGLRAGIAMPYSCAMGGCGACMVRVAAGDVVQDEPSCLTAEEREAGHVLACCARPRTRCRIEVPS